MSDPSPSLQGLSLPQQHWRALIQGSLHRHRNDPTARYLQLATVDSLGYPHNRTLVFRGFLRDTEILQFAVDSRSQKIAQLRAHPQAQACWYFPKTREQFRITGILKAIDATASDPASCTARAQLWSHLSAQAKQLWYWPEPRLSRSPLSDYATAIPEHNSEPPETFVLLWLDPNEVDHLHLKGDLIYPQTRSLYIRLAEGWQSQLVNP